jgi:hypothetical protein
MINKHEYINAYVYQMMVFLAVSCKGDLEIRNNTKDMWLCGGTDVV